MSKRKHLSEGVQKRTSGSAYDEDNGLELGDDFLADLNSGTESVLVEENTQLKQQLEMALLPVGDGLFRYQRFQMTLTSLVPPDDMTDDEADMLGEMLAGLDSASQFWMGDWANLYVKEVEDKDERSVIYDRLAEQFDIERQTLKDYAYVCRNVAPSLRNDALYFSHHRFVAKVTDAKLQKKLLSYAAKKGMSATEFRKYVSEQLRSNKSDDDLPDVIHSIFKRERIPKLDKSLEKLWIKAQNDPKARSEFLKTLSSFEDWIDEARQTLSDE